MFLRRAHDPELDAAAYVSGELRGRARRHFERHLLECERCWAEVSVDREGRRIAESVRELAPPDLRDAVRAAVLGSTSDRRRSRARPVLATAAAIVAVTAVTATFLVTRTPAEPAPIAAALDAHRDSVVRGEDLSPAPDLGMAGLTLTGAERMSLGDMKVEAFAYRDESGSRLSLFMADHAFPRAVGATADARVTDGWLAERDGMHMLGGSQGLSYLAVTTDPSVMNRLESGLSSGEILLA